MKDKRSSFRTAAKLILVKSLPSPKSRRTSKSKLHAKVTAEPSLVEAPPQEIIQ